MRIQRAGLRLKLGEDVAVIDPENEAQVRPLTLLPAEKQAEAWERALEASHGHVTAASVARVVEEMLADDPRTARPVPAATGRTASPSPRSSAA